MNDIFIYRSNGQYLGFIRNTNLYSRDGIYLGYLTDNYAWDTLGQYRGALKSLSTPSGNKYFIIRNMYGIPPYPQVARSSENLSINELPSQLSPINPILRPVGYMDGF